MCYDNVHFNQYCASFPSNKPPKCQNWNFDKIMQKRGILFVYLPNTSHFIHFQSVWQKKWNIHNKTNEYWWHFRSKSHQTTSLTFAFKFAFVHILNDHRHYTLHIYRPWPDLFNCNLSKWPWPWLPVQGHLIYLQYIICRKTFAFKFVLSGSSQILLPLLWPWLCPFRFQGHTIS